MRNVIVRSAIAAAIASCFVLMPAAASPTAPRAPGVFAFAATAQGAAASRVVKRPVRGSRASSPPAGARASAKIRFARDLSWKSDPRSHAVFAVGPDRQVWFIDAQSGWPYTVDAAGEVFTADPRTGTVYSLGPLSRWSGDLLYVFSFWDLDGGRYRLPAYDTWVTYYEDDAHPGYGWDETYEEVWEFEEFYASDDYDDIELELLEAEADALEAEADALEAEADALEAEADALEDEADAYEDEAYDEAYEDDDDVGDEYEDEYEDDESYED